MKIPKVHINASIRCALEKINEHGLGIVFIVDDNNKFVGLVTDGDIRRALLRGVSLHTKIFVIANKNPIKIYEFWSEEKVRKYLESPEVKRHIPKFKALIIPVLTRDNKVVGFRFLYPDKKNQESYHLQSHPDKTRLLPKKILVIGGAGYIGSVLVRMLLEKGYYVKVMDNLLYGDEGIKELYDRENFEFFRGDITNIRDIVNAISNVDTVIHLAAIVGDPASKIKPKETLEINYFSTKALCDVAKYLGISKFIFASTCSVYGFKNKICDERTDPNPLSLYAETKLMAEKALLASTNGNFCPVVLRFATVYGWSPRMRFDLVVNLLIAKGLVDKEITVFGKGLQYRPFIHVKDAARAIVKVLEAPPKLVCGEIFNVGSDEQNMSIRELAEKMARKMPDAKIKFIAEKEDERSYIVSFRKISEKLGFVPIYNIDVAIDEIKEAFKKGLVSNYRDKKYSNYKSLKDNFIVSAADNDS